MTTKTKQAWGLTRDRAFYVEPVYVEEGDAPKFRLWAIPLSTADTSPFYYDGLSSIVAAVRFMETTYPTDTISGVMVMYDNAVELDIRNGEPDEQFREITWRMDQTGLPETPRGSLTVSINHPFASSVENILDGAPAMWAEINDRES